MSKNPDTIGFKRYNAAFKRTWKGILDLTAETRAWLAGLYEGEGAFMWVGDREVRVALMSTDKDIVERAAALIQGSVRGPYWFTKSTKQVWKVDIHGVKALTFALEIFPWLGRRRRSKVIELLDRWEHASA